ncbi:hypothetical protein C8Q74DRAFT_1435121 [Fomes fomentarius]|nr:hypothetical protein C8Q74DRAFT_1435121 [Fomes fomentarius]
MYRTVHLRRSDQVEPLLRTLEENSHLAHLVVKLKVVVAGYIPFTQFARLLQNCVIINIYGIDWKDYSPRFADTCLYPFSLLGIVRLKLMVSKSTARGLLRFVRSLIKLEQLTLTGDESLTGMEPIAALGARRSQNGNPAALSKLKKLKLRGTSVCITFPPHYFGDAVVDLSLHFSEEEISHFHRLQTLDIDLTSDEQDDTYDPQSMSKIRRLFWILSSVSSGPALHVLKVSLFPTLHSPHTLVTPRNWSYLVDRSGLLKLLVGANMLKVLDGFPSLSQLRFKLWENDDDYNEAWWKKQMVRRLPSRFHAVTIELYMYDRPHLWLTEDEITPSTEENEEDIATNDLGVSSSTMHQLDPVSNDGGFRRKMLGGLSTHRGDSDLESENLLTVILILFESHLVHRLHNQRNQCFIHLLFGVAMTVYVSSLSPSLL